MLFSQQFSLLAQIVRVMIILLSKLCEHEFHCLMLGILSFIHATDFINSTANGKYQTFVIRCNIFEWQVRSQCIRTSAELQFSIINFDPEKLPVQVCHN